MTLASASTTVVAQKVVAEVSKIRNVYERKVSHG